MPAKPPFAGAAHSPLATESASSWGLTAASSLSELALADGSFGKLCPHLTIQPHTNPQQWIMINHPPRPEGKSTLCYSLCSRTPGSWARPALSYTWDHILTEFSPLYSTSLTTLEGFAEHHSYNKTQVLQDREYSRGMVVALYGDRW